MSQRKLLFNEDANKIHEDRVFIALLIEFLPSSFIDPDLII